ncbi:MAG: bifunctional demethylmenaquinone methyltransferase/2-methoxy-6-polyprenyl-1,4-benzoquinol methylase UbiE [Deltaproteobacteria bacterium]|nr:bifunctional demethylmenaquinone methyltransferase/2-methoxy-6-polyprenyl-1,4-benzoquinol methylase UbiE [Deltaproteobacteria bacterium]
MEEKTPKPAGLDEFAYFGYQPVAPAEKEKLVHRHFDTVSSRYDFMNTLLSFGMHYPWKWTAVRLLKLKAGDRVLDVCGGTADLALLAASKIGPAGRVAVYDINRAMMAAGQPKVARAKFTSRIAFLQGDAEHLSCPDASFDAAMVGFGIRNLTHPEQGFKEMHRVLKPGGRLMCLEFSQPVTSWFRRLYDFYSFYIMPLMGRLFVGSWQAYTYLPESIRMFADPEEVSATLAGLGFKEIRYRRLTNGIAVIHLAVKP